MKTYNKDIIKVALLALFTAIVGIYMYIWGDPHNDIFGGIKALYGWLK